jgi:CheY-like chemotaxis protein/HPt (histidine-containing phosphotransfer) domain-containing protein
MAPGQPEAETRFVVLGWGQRRRPRVDAVDLVTLDADAMLRRTLFKVLALAAGRIGDDESNDEQHRKPGPAAAPERDKALQPGRTILVAEDNETNRVVIRQQLELIGFAAELVVNGRDALACWRRGGFALLLTDLHMPEMDGYELAAAIRAEEGAGSRLPIIALSANALHDEELRCRDAGMDAFLTKPIRLPQLRAAIEARLGSAAPAVAALPAAGEPAAAAAPTLDMKVLVALVGDDQAVIGNVLQAFRRSAARASAAMAQGLADGSAKAVSDAAHMLKSGALSIGARPLGNLCVDIEKTAEAGRVDALSLLVPRFEAELAAVLCFLDSRQRTLDRASSK